MSDNTSSPTSPDAIQLKELRILYAVAQACAEAQNENQVIREVTHIINEHELADLFVVFLLDAQREVLLVHPGHKAVSPYKNVPPIPLGQGMTGVSALHKTVRYAPNTAVDEAYLDFGSHMASALCVPLLSHGRVLGVINAERRAIDSFEPFAQRLFTSIASQLSVTITRLKTEANSHRYTQQIIAMQEMAQKVTRTLELEDVLQGIIDEVSTLVQAEGVAVLLRHPTEPLLEFAAVSGLGAIRLQHTTMPLHEGIAGQVIQTGQPIAVNSRQQTAHVFYQQAETVSGFQAQALLAVPIFVDNQPLGVIEAAHSQPDHFAPDALALLEASANWAAIALKNAQLYSQLGQQYQQLQRSQAQLIQAEKLSALGRLAASVAHEINNPIQAIQGCLTLITEELDAPQPGKQGYQAVASYLEIVQTELVRVASIVQRMRDFYRPAREGQYPTAVTVILESVLELSQKQLEYARVKVYRDWSANLPLILANPNHLKQVFLNLLLNALDAMPEGGELHLAACLAGEEAELLVGHTAVVITFQDHGRGIAPADIEQLFEPFFTTKEDGSGLGLSISYNIIQAHKGHIFVDSTLGQGTTFTILLPAISAEETM